MSETVEAAALSVLTQFSHKDKWEAWGMNEFRPNGSCILLEGPSGTGKTTIAKWLAHKINKGFKQLSISALSAGGGPGATEKAVVDFFEDCRSRHNATIFMDEVDHLLGQREKITGEALTWMLGTLETLLIEISRYKGVIIMATNHAGQLDSAIEQRLLAIIHVGRPDFAMRARLWKDKWPVAYPFKPTPEQINKLAEFDLTGRQIENVFVAATQAALRRRIKPNIKVFVEHCQAEVAKHIVRE